LEQVKEFTYLGAVITKDGSCEKDIRHRIGWESAIFGRLNKIWRDNHVTIQTKTTMYEIFVISVLLYGAECWTVRKVDKRRIFTAEMGWLRKLGGINKRQQKKKTKISGPS